MTDWPTVPLIRITRGTVDGDAITGAIAYHRGGGRYALLSAKHRYKAVAPGYRGDSVTEWEEVTPVPTSALKRLQEERRRELALRDLRAAIDGVLEVLPIDEFGALTRAVTRVKDVAALPMVDTETPCEERLSLLLRALAGVQGAPHKGVLLATVTRICADWVQANEAEVEAIGLMRRETEGSPELDDSDADRFFVLAGLVGEVAGALSGARENFSPELVSVGAYSLAWAAQIIKEEES